VTNRRWCCLRVAPCIALVVLATAPALCLASRWIEVGNSGVSTDKVMVDADSVQKVDEFRLANVMTVYAAPRTNANGITSDRHVRRIAMDCAHHTFVGIVTIGYLNGKRSGSSPETQDWRTKMKPLPTDGMTQRVYALVCGAAIPGGAPQARPAASTGSGIVVDEQGAVLTNQHVVSGCKSLTVQGLHARAVPAVLDAVDSKNDLALIKTRYGVPVGEPARFRSNVLPAKLGESIGVIGYPLSGLLSAEPKATFGQVNSVAGYNNDYTLLQISAPVQPGNSGGPVLDGAGLVIGVVVSQASLAMTALVGNVPQNVNFAIRGEVAQIFLAGRGVTVRTGRHQHPLATEEIAAAGEKVAVFVRCSRE